MFVTISLFVASAIAIYLSSEFFVNGVEWVGYRLKFSQAATGTILAAFGTALPESAVTFVAVAFGTSGAEKNIGIGAALGGPLALSTLAYSVVGLALMRSARESGVQRKITAADAAEAGRSQGWFLGIFIAGVALGSAAFAGKRWIGFIFLAAYALYVRWQVRTSGGSADLERPGPLKVRPHQATPSIAWACFQTLAALVIIFAASRIFVGQLEAIGPRAGLPPQMTALLLSPIATELPEMMNALIWVRQGRTRMALGNIGGAMMIQATIPTALGLFFSPWRLDAPSFLAAGATVIATAALLLAFRDGNVNARALVLTCMPYLVFIGLVWMF